jgi:preprotein translocase subunit SecE
MPGQHLSTSVKPKKSRFAFVVDIISELRKVVWPTRQEAVRLTIMVIGVCAAVGIFLGAVDYGFAELITKVFLGG